LPAGKPADYGHGELEPTMDHRYEADVLRKNARFLRH
jgi:hypothetical protein